MADKKVILSAEEALARAKRVRELKPDFCVTLRLDVALALMKDRNLVPNRWLGDGGILEVRPATEEDKLAAKEKLEKKHATY
jgi:hypothetical protein